VVEEGDSGDCPEEWTREFCEGVKSDSIQSNTQNEGNGPKEKVSIDSKPVIKKKKQGPLKLKC
jgi:hypothetical protein